MNKYLFISLLNLLPLAADAQTVRTAPRLVVNITIDQLRTDYLEHFSPFYRPEGFRRLMAEGRIYNEARYPFSPVDRASAVACVATGTTPDYNKIVAEQWFNRATLRPEYCVSSKDYLYSPERIASSTIGDELKVATDGKARVYSFAWEKDAAILSGGHAADGAFWINEDNNLWCTSIYYPGLSANWISAYNSVYAGTTGNKKNDIVVSAALECVKDNAMGKDGITDYLAITLSARLGKQVGQRSEMEGVYRSLDKSLIALISEIEARVGKDNVMFVLTATGDTEEPDTDYAKYRIPSGTFYINRTAQLLNMYLSAIYGNGRWVEGYFKNQIFLSHKLIEDHKLSYSEVIKRSKEMLLWTSGIAKIHNTPEDSDITGDLIIEVRPGWKILNEDTNQSYNTRNAYVSFPIIFMGKDIKAEHVNTPVTTDRIAATIAKCIQIRAPNACAAIPLF